MCVCACVMRRIRFMKSSLNSNPQTPFEWLVVVYYVLSRPLLSDRCTCTSTTTTHNAGVLAGSRRRHHRSTMTAIWGRKCATIEFHRWLCVFGSSRSRHSAVSGGGRCIKVRARVTWADVPDMQAILIQGVRATSKSCKSCWCWRVVFGHSDAHK